MRDVGLGRAAADARRLRLRSRGGCGRAEPPIAGRRTLNASATAILHPPAIIAGSCSLGGGPAANVQIPAIIAGRRTGNACGASNVHPPALIYRSSHTECCRRIECAITGTHLPVIPHGVLPPQRMCRHRQHHHRSSHSRRARRDRMCRHRHQTSSHRAQTQPAPSTS